MHQHTETVIFSIRFERNGGPLVSERCGDVEKVVLLAGQGIRHHLAVGRFLTATHVSTLCDIDGPLRTPQWQPRPHTPTATATSKTHAQRSSAIAMMDVGEADQKS